MKEFDSFLRNKEYELNSLKLIDEDISLYILSIYNKISQSSTEECKKLKERYDKLVSLIPEHNKTVNTINNGMVGFNYSKILDNPSLYNYSKTYMYLEIVNLIEKFTNVSKEYKDFSIQVNNISKYYNYLCI